MKITAAPDGRSLIFTGSVHNQSSNAVRQVLFPDLMGLVPVGKAADTMFRHSLGASRPFIDLAPNEGKLSEQYMTDNAAFASECQSGGMFSTMGLRWLDYGSLKGGLSLFSKQWGWDPPIAVRLHLSEVEEKLRLLVRHDMALAPGEQWQSQEFWLTPHAGGWAKGIEPFRAWVKQNYKRQFPLPKRVRDGIGFRTIWMCQIYPQDPQDAIFKFSDLPALAKESAAHGLEEMVMWAWAPGFERPLPPPFPHLGTEQEFYDAVKSCRQLGVTVSPFISVVQATKSNAAALRSGRRRQQRLDLPHRAGAALEPAVRLAAGLRRHPDLQPALAGGRAGHVQEARGQRRAVAQLGPVLDHHRRRAEHAVAHPEDPRIRAPARSRGDVQRRTTLEPGD